MSRKLEMKLDPEEDKLSLPSSSEDEEEEENSEASDEEPVIEDPFAKDDDSDSDSAPEALSFRDALESDRNKRIQTHQVIRTQMEERRKKRKELHDEFLRKKDEKRQKIESKMLPEAILNGLDDDTFKESATPIIKMDENVSMQQSPDEAEEINDDVIEDVATDEDVLAVHGPTVFMCKNLKESKRHIPERYLTLKNQLLYGKRIRRETSARNGMLKRQKQLIQHGHVC